MTVLVITAAVVAGIATVPAAIAIGTATVATVVITTVTTATVTVGPVVAARIIVHCYQAVLLGIVSVVSAASVTTAPVRVLPACIGPVITATASVATEEKIEKAETTAIVITIITHLNFFP